MSNAHPTLPSDDQFQDIPPLSSVHPSERPEPSGVEPPEPPLRTDPDRGVGELGTEGTDPSWLILPKGDEEPTKSPARDVDVDDEDKAT